MNLKKTKWLFPVLILLFFLPSCTGTESRISKSPVVETPQQAAPAADEARQSMAAGEYRKAIDIYQSEIRKQPKDQPLIKEYTKSLEGIRLSADRALEKGDFAGAGQIYFVLHNTYAKLNPVASTLSFDQDYLNTKLSYCRKSLSTQGFQEYRQGNLNRAINIWHHLLAIDPNNKDIKEILRTATVQQKNLREKN